MSKTYQATGINLKGMPLGEADRLITILTEEFGIIKVVAPGARKHKSQFRGRSELFVVNQLLIAKGRSLDKITQAETLQTYPGLSQNINKLAASQYLAELVLCLALSEQPQIEIYKIFNEHLRRIELLDKNQSVQPNLAQAVFHLLAIAGVAPVVNTNKIVANFSDPNWQIGFSFNAGGLISKESSDVVNTQLGALELTLLQQLGAISLPQVNEFLPQEFTAADRLEAAWIKVERVLREYAQYHCGRSLRSGALVDSLSAI